MLGNNQISRSLKQFLKAKELKSYKAKESAKSNMTTCSRFNSEYERMLYKMTRKQFD